MNHEEFNYTYAAPTQSERKEIEELRKKYLPQEKPQAGTFEQLKALDKKVQNPPTIIALVLGVFGTLVFGMGLTMILEWELLIFGAIVAVVGIVPLALAYPVYRKTLEKRKKKYGAEILALSQKLLENQAL